MVTAARVPPPSFPLLIQRTVTDAPRDDPLYLFHIFMKKKLCAVVCNHNDDDDTKSATVGLSAARRWLAPFPYSPFFVELLNFLSFLLAQDRKQSRPQGSSRHTVAYPLPTTLLYCTDVGTVLVCVCIVRTCSSCLCIAVRYSRLVARADCPSA